MLVDANLLLYAVDKGGIFHTAASHWLSEVMNAEERVGIPGQTIAAFLRVSTHPKIWATPLTSAQAWGYVNEWLERPMVWVPPADESTVRIADRLNATIHVTANLVPDLMLAAQGLQYGLEVLTADTDFARFPGVRWRNPLLAL
jgi:uncharacterized protein